MPAPAERALGMPERSTATPTAPEHATRAVLIVPVVFLPLGVCAIAAEDPGPAAAALSVAALIGTYVLFLLLSLPVRRRIHGHRLGLTLTAQGVLGFLPVVAPGPVWPGMAGYFAGSLLLTVAARTGRVLAALAVAGGCAAAIGEGAGPANWLYAGWSTAVVALVVYGTARLSRLVLTAREEREMLAWRAVEQERRRYARDLHDLLGYSLSAITLKGDLAQRLVRQHPERSREELDGLLVVARQALSDVRTVARGYRDLSLTLEAESARSLLTAADIRTGVDLRCESQGPVGTVLATVLREGVTNIVRHSKATECRIETRRTDGGFVRLVITNDGAGAVRSGPFPCLEGSGSGGLANLAERLAAIGGRLTVDTDERGWYRVTAEAPAHFG
ncbi:histidine kinase [Streptomyces sp. DG2A-72]|uniref:sensor histidine kinase n=1 Tax=Streptomyces sp. DG2A-72 TaxID=3051386 RepID=UPI00265B9743|nr:histidine kinase [Streptomyces sp. DG2A-72]MDO0931736.1 histidine kinase [Streptomyces sp. DG2A-72]